MSKYCFTTQNFGLCTDEELVDDFAEAFEFECRFQKRPVDDYIVIIGEKDELTQYIKDYEPDAGLKVIKFNEDDYSFRKPFNDEVDDYDDLVGERI